MGKDKKIITKKTQSFSMIKEGTIKKGGINNPPTTQKPNIIPTAQKNNISIKKQNFQKKTS